MAPEDMERPWARSGQEVLRTLDVSADSGLSSEEVRKRRKRCGPNRLCESETVSAWQILLEQFKSIIVLLLVAAAALSFAFSKWVEGVAVLVMIAIDAASGFVTELRAVRSMEALQHLGNVRAKVRREAAMLYAQLAGAGDERASNDLERVVPAAHWGRVESLFVAAGVQWWGSFDPDANVVQLCTERTHGDEDLLDFAAVHTFLNDGDVYRVEPEEVPGGSAVAAMFRY
jgi:hypothetical protein